MQWCMFVAILLFAACLYQILEGEGEGGRITNTIMQSKKDQCKQEREPQQTYAKFLARKISYKSLHKFFSFEVLETTALS